MFELSRPQLKCWISAGKGVYETAQVLLKPYDFSFCWLFNSAEYLEQLGKGGCKILSALSFVIIFLLLPLRNNGISTPLITCSHKEANSRKDKMPPRRPNVLVIISPSQGKEKRVGEILTSVTDKVKEDEPDTLNYYVYRSLADGEGNVHYVVGMKYVLACPRPHLARFNLYVLRSPFSFV